RDLVNIVGREALSERDNRYLDFADRFEEEFVDQGFQTERTIEETLDIGWDLLSMLPQTELNRIDEEFIEEYYRDDEQEALEAEA
ncbi:MAG: V-type ATP synthase subunit B, partial [Haloplanus sp.]